MIKRPAIAAVLIALISAVASAAPASDEKMADEAIIPSVPRDPEKRDQILNRRFAELAELATQAPNQIRAATVYFNTGLSYRELHELRSDFDIEVIDVVLKAPQGDKGVVMSIMGGMAGLLAIKGSFEERLTFMMAKHQECFAKRARYMPPDESKGMADLATRPFSVYAARIFGQSRFLRAVQQQPFVRSVMLNVRSSAISDFEFEKSNGGPNPYTMPGLLC